MIKINAPSNLPPKKIEQTQLEGKYVTLKNPYTSSTTGYDINRELYSEEEIKEAFSLIDVNKDNALTFEDLTFILDCMGLAHSREEVEEMIRMVSPDHQHVYLDDFKKIGKGRMIPMAGLKMSDTSTKTKQNIFGNMKNTSILQHDP